MVAPNGYQVNLDCTIDRVGAVVSDCPVIQTELFIRIGIKLITINDWMTVLHWKANGFCSNDYMDVSRSGDLGTNTDQAYCGSTNFIVNSHVNRIAFCKYLVCIFLKQIRVRLKWIFECSQHKFRVDDPAHTIAEHIVRQDVIVVVDKMYVFFISISLQKSMNESIWTMDLYSFVSLVERQPWEMSSRQHVH